MTSAVRYDILTEFKRGETAEVNDCCAAIEKALQSVAKVNLKTHKVTIKCKNLIEELCTNDEIFDALVEQAKIRRPDGAAIKSRRKAHAGTQSVYVSLPAEDAKKVLAIGYINVGFIRSKVVEVIEPKRCFKCWGYGHTSLTCKEQDRTKLCRKCGEDGHKAATCTNPRKCALCNGNHSVGNVMCPHYQEAVRKLRS